MKHYLTIISTLLIMGCTQNLGSYMAVNSNHACKSLRISPNYYNIDENVYAQVSTWLKTELPRLGYQVVDNHQACGEVCINYGANLIPVGNETFPPTSVDSQGEMIQDLIRYQLSLEMINLETQESFLNMSTELESMESNINKVLPKMQNALYAKFLPVTGPQSQVLTTVKTNAFAVKGK